MPEHTQNIPQGGDGASLQSQAFLSLELGEWVIAAGLFDRLLMQNPEDAVAYLGKLLATHGCHSKDQLKDLTQPFDHDPNYAMVMRYGSEPLRQELRDYNDRIRADLQSDSRDEIYLRAVELLMRAHTEEDYFLASKMFREINGYKDADVREMECLQKAKMMQKEAVYHEASQCQLAGTVSALERAAELFQSISGYIDAGERAAACRMQVIMLKDKERQLAAQKKAKSAKFRKIFGLVSLITLPTVCVAVLLVFLFGSFFLPNAKYNDALQLMEQGSYTEAIAAFEALDDYKDSAQKITECSEAITRGKYDAALAKMKQGDHVAAIEAFEKLGNYADSKEMVKECSYQYAVSQMEQGDYSNAIRYFEDLKDYKDSAQLLAECGRISRLQPQYDEAVALMNGGDLEAAMAAFEALGDYADSKEKYAACETGIKQAKFDAALLLMEEGDLEGAAAAFGELGEFGDSAAKLAECEALIKEQERSESSQTTRPTKPTKPSKKEQYEAAAALQKQGKYADAYKAFQKLGDYQDAKAKAAKIKKDHPMAFVKVGATVKFGKYEQNGNTGSKEKIEWIVLAKSGGKLLLISKNILDSMPYNNESTPSTWADSDMRSYLNGSFYNSVFSAAEKKKIVTTKVKTPDNPNFKTDGGANANCRVFLLSAEETSKYLKTNAARQGKGTAAAKSGGLRVGANGTSRWWLRTVGGKDNFAVLVDEYGGIDMNGFYTTQKDVGLRPAIWIKAE